MLKLKKVTAGYSQYQIIANFKLIEDFINDKVLKREVSRGEANQMLGNLILSPTEVGDGVGHVSLTGVDGLDEDLCFTPVSGGPGCTISGDIIIVMDNTGSQNIIEYETFVKPAVANMVQSWISLGRDIKVGLVIMRNDPAPFLQSGLTTNLASIVTDINAIIPPSGSTDLGSATDVAVAELNTNKRTGFPGIIVMITDGAPNTPQPALTLGEDASTAAFAAGYRVVVFGVVGIDNSTQPGGGVG